jgi:hypothetical protein
VDLFLKGVFNLIVIIFLHLHFQQNIFTSVETFISAYKFCTMPKANNRFHILHSHSHHNLKRSPAMADLKGPLDCFNESKDKILAVSNDNLAKLNLPIEEAMQEGRRVEALVGKYSSELSRSDINPKYLETISVRAGAFAYTVATMDSSVKVGQDHYEKYQELKKEGYTVRKRINSDFRYVFRKDQTVLDTLDVIGEGKGDFDMIRDLLSLYKLSCDYRTRIQSANVDLTIIDSTDRIYKELFNLTAQLDIDPKKVEESKQLCMKAWTYLWEAMDEIYQAGRFVFFTQPEIEELFYIDYLQQMAKTRAKDNKPVPTEEPVALA